MLEPSQMFPNGFHPVKIDKNRNFKGKAIAYTRTQRLPRYILIDFGLSRQYQSREITDNPLRGGDKSAPEHQSRRPSNPFHTDIYYIGNLVRENFTMVCDSIISSRRNPHLSQKYRGFRFMEDLISAMTREHPADRPHIEDVIERFNEIRGSLSKIKLRSALMPKEAPIIICAALETWQYVRTIRYILSQKAAIPDPRQ